MKFFIANSFGTARELNSVIWGQAEAAHLHLDFPDLPGQFQECPTNLERRGSAEFNPSRENFKFFVCWMRQSSFSESGECHQCLIIKDSSTTTPTLQGICIFYVFPFLSQKFRKYGSSGRIWDTWATKCVFKCCRQVKEILKKGLIKSGWIPSQPVTSECS